MCPEGEREGVNLVRESQTHRPGNAAISEGMAGATELEQAAEIKANSVRELLVREQRNKTIFHLPSVSPPHPPGVLSVICHPSTHSPQTSAWAGT